MIERGTYTKIRLDEFLALLGGFDLSPAIEMRGGRPTWREDRARFEKLWRSGIPVAEIAERLDRSQRAVNIMRCLFKLPPRRPQNKRVLARAA